jgi:thioredoxin-like negative regulator of GroEL
VRIHISIILHTKINIIDNPATAEDKFTKLLKNNKSFVCYYYWKNCGHCTQFSPLWNKIIQQYKENFTFVKIELECMKLLPAQYMVSGFPTVLIYKNGDKYKEFQKERNEKNLHNFIKTYMLDNNKDTTKKHVK